jgi:ATP-binding cassette subfamily F protein 3
MVRLARETTQAGALSGQGTREQDLRNFLGRFQFSGDMVMQAVGTMSGGEKARLVLCMMVWLRPNLLLLDEPTNHLDLATREALAMALNGFDGTVVLVSHDRALLRTVCEEFWLVAGGGVEPFDGDLDDYQRYLLDMARQAREGAANTAPQAASPAATPAVPSPTALAQPRATPGEQRRQDAQKRQQLAQQLKPHRQRIEHIDKRMATLQAESTRLHDLLMAPAERDALADAGRRLKAIETEMAELEEQWLATSETIERLEQAVL